MKTFRYDPAMVQPMRDELTQIGFEELLTPEAVDEALSATDGTVLVVVNSVCGCGAGSARPWGTHSRSSNRLSSLSHKELSRRWLIAPCGLMSSRRESMR